MKILWYSATPECHSGYGNASRSMISWLTQQGHWVAAATKHPMAIRWRMWDVPGTDKKRPIMAGTNIDVINDDVMDRWNLDCCISMFDVWGLEKPIKRHIPWIPIDTQNVSEKILKKCEDTEMTIAMSQHGQQELKANGVDAMYAPIGYDPDVFKPRPEGAEQFRTSLTWPDGLKPEDMYLIGSVGLNYPDDRKGFILLLQAFKSFREDHPEARLYLHTQAAKKKEGMTYARIAKELGVMDYIAWPDQAQFWFGQYDAETLAVIYSAMDVFCLPTRGEGFGLPVIEAQACGTPVVVTDNTTGPELTKYGKLIWTDGDDYVFTGLNTWRVQPKPSAVHDSLRSIYDHSFPIMSNWQESVAEYAWPNVWEKHWQPIMDEIESRLPFPGYFPEGYIACKDCGTRIKKQGKRLYCNNKCRSRHSGRAYRKRQKAQTEGE